MNFIIKAIKNLFTVPEVNDLNAFYANGIDPMLSPQSRLEDMCVAFALMQRDDLAHRKALDKAIRHKMRRSHIRAKMMITVAEMAAQEVRIRALAEDLGNMPGYVTLMGETVKICDIGEWMDKNEQE